jgi:hypothetical protein
VQVKNITPKYASGEGRGYYAPGVGFLGALDLAGRGVICSSFITPVQLEIPNDDLRNVSSIAVEIVPASAR